MNIILGSQSPRRRELLAGLDIPFTAITIDADESYPGTLSGGDIPIYISRAKARAYAHNLQNDDILITADTIVYLDGQVLGKPHDEQDAKAMLRLLSGRTHQVYTGVTLSVSPSSPLYAHLNQLDSTDQNNDLGIFSFVDCTDVTFRELSDEEISYYVEHYHPLDKAGAYGVQEYIGYMGVTSLHGSYFNVMGLPLEPLYRHLMALLPTP